MWWRMFSFSETCGARLGCVVDKNLAVRHAQPLECIDELCRPVSIVSDRLYLYRSKRIPSPPKAKSCSCPPSSTTVLGRPSFPQTGRFIYLFFFFFTSISSFSYFQSVFLFLYFFFFCSWIHFEGNWIRYRVFFFFVFFCPCGFYFPKKTTAAWTTEADRRERNKYSDFILFFSPQVNTKNLFLC